MWAACSVTCRDFEFISKSLGAELQVTRALVPRRGLSDLQRRMWGFYVAISTGPDQSNLARWPKVGFDDQRQGRRCRAPVRDVVFVCRGISAGRDLLAKAIGSGDLDAQPARASKDPLPELPYLHGLEADPQPS